MVRRSGFGCPVGQPRRAKYPAREVDALGSRITFQRVEDFAIVGPISMGLGVRETARRLPGLPGDRCVTEVPDEYTILRFWPTTRTPI
jgi:hypothetical protein